MPSFTAYEVKEASKTRRFSLQTKTQTAKVLNHLIAAGEHGVTAQEVSSWLLRMSEYIRRLRADHELTIDMVKEEHSDPWGNKSWHGRYILRTDVQRVAENVEAA